MQQIAKINLQLGQINVQDATSAVLRDKRDGYIDQLSQLMNIKVVDTSNNKVSIFTGAGVQLVGDTAVQLKFDAKGSLTPDSQWDADPAKRSVGTIMIDAGANVVGLDLIANKVITSGKLASLLQMRDQVLPQAQAQVDQIAAAMSSALSNKTVDGTAVAVAGQNGFDVDLGSLKDGNTVNISYTDATGATKTLTIMRVDDPRAAAARDRDAGRERSRGRRRFSKGMASVITQIQNGIGTSGVKFYNPSGTTLRVMDDGVGGTINVKSVTATSTVTSLTGGSGELPFFLDGTRPIPARSRGTVRR